MTDIEKLLESSYKECCDFLIKKYGPVPYDYFLKENCKTKNAKNGRAKKDGLFIHHIDEDKAIMLSTPEYARMNPFDFQKADRLVYCNLLEHLVLHIKIYEEPSPEQNENELVGVGGIYNFIVPELNDIYSGIQYDGWKKTVSEVVLPLKEDYFKCIKRLVDMKFEYPLLTSFSDNPEMGWRIENNYKLFEELKKIGVKN